MAVGGKMKKSKIRRMTLLALFAAIEIVLAFTPLGFVPIAPIKATTLHIPVIIASLVLGYQDGMIVGFIFGLCSLINATFNPTVLSFVFSPFVTIGGYSGNFTSLIIVFVPRILLGALPYFIYKAFKNLNPKVATFIASLIATLIHTLLVMGLIYLFFGLQFASLNNTTLNGVLIVIISIITSNGLAEALLAGFICSAVAIALKHISVNTGVKNEK